MLLLAMLLEVLRLLTTTDEDVLELMVEEVDLTGTTVLVVDDTTGFVVEVLVLLVLGTGVELLGGGMMEVLVDVTGGKMGGAVVVVVEFSAA